MSAPRSWRATVPATSNPSVNAGSAMCSSQPLNDVVIPRVTRRREDVPLHGEDRDQDDGEPEARDRDADARKRPRARVEGSAGAHPGEDAERHSDQERDHCGGDDQAECYGEPFRDLLRDRLAGDERFAEIPLHGIAEPPEVLRQQRVVESELGPDGRDRLRRRIGPSRQGNGGISRYQCEEQEVNQRNQEQDRDDRCQASQDQSAHTFPPSGAEVAVGHRRHGQRTPSGLVKSSGV